MKKNILLLIINLILSQIGTSQNIIPNGDFESYSTLPTSEGQWIKCNNWSNANVTTINSPDNGSPDYFHNNGSGSIDLPYSDFATVFPYSGDAIMGFVGIDSSISDFREYLSARFTSPMDSGITYIVSLWITNGTPKLSGWSINHIGIRFSTFSLTQVRNRPIGGVPQLEISGQVWSTTWQAVSFSFTADAAYNYFTIGNFNNDVGTTSVSQAPSLFGGAYYFIDKIEVVREKLSVMGNTEVCIGDSITLVAKNGVSYTWADKENSSVIISNNSLLKISPAVSTTYVIKSDKDTIYYTVNVRRPPSINLGSDTVLCEGVELILNAANSSATYLWQDNSSKPTFSVTQHGTYWVQAINNCGTTTDTINIKSKESQEVLVMPNIFTPNNDGVNDSFFPLEISGYNDASLIIYNRWGEKLFEMNNMKSGWDGKYNNKNCTDGVYYWIIKNTNNCKNKQPNGFFSLIR